MRKLGGRLFDSRRVREFEIATPQRPARKMVYVSGVLAGKQGEGATARPINFSLTEIFFSLENFLPKIQNIRSWKSLILGEIWRQD